MGPSAGHTTAAGATPEAVAPDRGRRWGALVGLAAAVLFFGVAEGFALVALPLGVLLVGLSMGGRGLILGAVALAWALAFVPVGGDLQTVSRGWGLLLGGAFLASTLLCPRWCPFSRGLAAVALTFAVAAALVVATGNWARLDWAMAEHFRSVAALGSTELLGRWQQSRWAAELATLSGRMAELQALLFPALLALQSLAALALAWWGYARSRPDRDRRLALRPLREFRFNDTLIWLLIAGLLLILLPAGEGVARVGYNLLLFMCALYVLRGVAVFVFLARGAPRGASLVLGALATVLFYPLVFTAALLVGLGDTWLDVRGRVMAAASQV
jgi:hypothetical protein